MTVGWLKVRRSSWVGSGSWAASDPRTPAPTSAAAPVVDPTATTRVRKSAIRIRPTGSRAGAALCDRRAAMSARVRGDSRIGGRAAGALLAEPVIGSLSANDLSRLHHGVQEAQVLDLPNGPAAPSRLQPQGQRDEVSRLALGPTARFEMPDQRSGPC